MSILTTEFQREAFASGRFIRVVNWHNTPESERGTLRRELAWYLDRFSPVMPEDLDRFFDSGEWHLPKPGFIPVFYDSYLNHATVAAPVCDELGLRAWFFPPTTFLTVPPEQQQAYADAHDIDLVAEERSQPRLAMSLDDLAQIGKRHVIAGHTANHEQAVNIRTPEDVQREVFEPLRLIQDVTGQAPTAFAWLYGRPFDADSVAGKAMLDAGVRYAVSNTAYQRIAD